jgi:hypothetical protein
MAAQQLAGAGRRTVASDHDGGVAVRGGYTPAIDQAGVSQMLQ